MSTIVFGNMQILHFCILIAFVCGAPDAGPCTVGRHEHGSCPFNPSRGMCEEEGDCAAGLECCDDGCGMICQNVTIVAAAPPTPLAPVSLPQPTTTVKPGTCYPPPYVRYCSAPVYDWCTSDSECYGAQKCCYKPCGRRCSPSKPPGAVGVCPIPTGLSKVCFYFTAKGACLQDIDCTNGQLCCAEGCGKVCKAPIYNAAAAPVQKPVITRKGTCPYVPMYYNCKVPFTYACRNDFDCDTNSKCCREPCSFRCRRVHITKAGSCPVPPSITYNQCRRVTRCADDGNCFGNEKCCDHPCGKQCVAAVTAKPGTCAAKPSAKSVYCISSVDNCHKDTDCQGAQKCCQHPCGNHCQNNVLPPKPGVCAPKPTGYQCLRWQNDCKVDRDCSGNNKCCATACGVGCVRPSFYLNAG